MFEGPNKIQATVTNKYSKNKIIEDDIFFVRGPTHKALIV